MNPSDELGALYEQWRKLTEDEARAIESAAWAQVDQFQAAKARLQPRITEVSQRLDAAAHRQQFRAVIEGLMQLERQNHVLLERQRRAAERRQQELDQASRNLRQIHKSYLPPPRLHWQSYS